jgi:hypothetical protein
MPSPNSIVQDMLISSCCDIIIQMSHPFQNAGQQKQENLMALAGVKIVMTFNLC